MADGKQELTIEPVKSKDAAGPSGNWLFQGTIIALIGALIGIPFTWFVVQHGKKGEAAAMIQTTRHKLLVIRTELTFPEAVGSAARIDDWKRRLDELNEIPPGPLADSLIMLRFKLIAMVLFNEAAVVSAVSVREDLYNRALRSYESAENNPNAKSYPALLASIHNNIATIHIRLSETRGAARNLKGAIINFRKAHDGFHTMNMRAEEVAVLINWGAALVKLAEFENKISNLDKAIECFDEALLAAEAIPDSAEIIRSRSQLGNALTMIGEERRSEDTLRQAIFQFQTVMEYLPVEYFPAEHSKVLASMGDALVALADIKYPLVSFGEGIKCLRDALATLKSMELEIESATLEFRLGQALARQGEREQNVSPLLESMLFFERSLLVRTMEAQPLKYASTKTAIGDNYVSLFLLKNDAMDLRKAENAFAEAERIHTAEAYPEFSANLKLRFHALDSLRGIGKGGY